MKVNQNNIKVGTRFGRLVVKEKIDTPKDINYNIGQWYLCECDCTNKKSVPGISLLSGNTKSCGCFKSEISSKSIKEKRKIMIKNGNTTRPISKTTMITLGDETKSLTEWAKAIGITKSALSNRILSGWPIEEALTVKKGDKRNVTKWQKQH